jgi:hypothetical protein
LLLNVQDALFALRRDDEPFDAWRGGGELICHQARQKVNSVNMADRAPNRSPRETAEKESRETLPASDAVRWAAVCIRIVAAQQSATAQTQGSLSLAERGVLDSAESSA